MVQSILASLGIIEHMERVHWSIMMNIILAIFRMDLWRETECGGTKKERSILGNGKATRLMAMGFTSPKQVIIKVTNEGFRLLFQVCEAWRRLGVVQQRRFLQRILSKWSSPWKWRVLLEGRLSLHRRFRSKAKTWKRSVEQFQRWSLLGIIQGW